MRSITLLALLSFTISYHTLGQSTGFSKLSNQMFFNILDYRPDSLADDFIEKYFPYLKTRYTGGWTAYPPEPIPKYQYTIHSLRFTKHPHFDAKFTEGQLDILSKEEKGGKPGAIDFRLWFVFKNKHDAQNAFAKLTHQFEALSKTKKVTRHSGKIVAEYSGEDDRRYDNSVLIILTKDEIYKDMYKIFFKLGSYEYPEYPQIAEPTTIE